MTKNKRTDPTYDNKYINNRGEAPDLINLASIIGIIKRRKRIVIISSSFIFGLTFLNFAYNRINKTVYEGSFSLLIQTIQNSYQKVKYPQFLVEQSKQRKSLRMNLFAGLSSEKVDLSFLNRLHFIWRASWSCVKPVTLALNLLQS